MFFTSKLETRGYCLCPPKSTLKSSNDFTDVKNVNSFVLLNKFDSRVSINVMGHTGISHFKIVTVSKLTY